MEKWPRNATETGIVALKCTMEINAFGVLVHLYRQNMRFVYMIGFIWKHVKYARQVGKFLYTEVSATQNSFKQMCITSNVGKLVHAVLTACSIIELLTRNLYPGRISLRLLHISAANSLTRFIISVACLACEKCIT